MGDLAISKLGFLPVNKVYTVTNKDNGSTKTRKIKKMLVKVHGLY